jgi:serine/threonine protein kinase/ABC-type branched-subunit amino acid transport system substrate-binding protein
MSYCINHFSCTGRDKNSIDLNKCDSCGESLLIGRYRLLEMIGNTSPERNWEVFIGKDTKINTNPTVIIKTLRINHSSNDTPEAKKLIGLFQKEAEVLRDIQHHGIPKLVRNVETLELENDREILYFVMEYIKGLDLKKWLKTNEKIEEKQAWQWLREIISILDCIHHHKVSYLHRDIKPDNIMLKEESNTLVLIDFGIVKSFNSFVQGKNTNIGTEGYKAPETNTGNGERRSEFYSLGRTFYHLSTGIYPQNRDLGRDWEKQTKFEKSTIISLIEWMVKENPDERPQTTSEILYAIDILSKPNQTREDAKKLIEKIRNPTQEDEGLRSQLQENLHRTQRLTNLNRATSDQLTTTITILGRLIRLYNTILRRFNRWKTITIRAFAGAILVLFIGGLMLKAFLDNVDRLNIATTTQLNNTIERLESQKAKLKSNLSATKAKLDDTKNIDKFISSGERPLEIFGERKDVEPKYMEIKQNAIKIFLAGDEAEANKKADFYKEAFKGFKEFYDRFGESSVADPEIPIYLNNSKVRYLESKYNVKKYTIAVVSPAQLETGQHILLGAALYQQQSVNNNSSTLKNNEIEERSSTNIYFEIKIADDRNSDDIRIAEKLAKDPKILAVVGPYSTEAIEATLRTYANANPPLAVVSPTASKYGLTQDYEGQDKKYEKNVFFRIISSTETEAKAWVDLINKKSLLKKQPNSIVAFYKPDENGKGFSQNIFSRFQVLTNKPRNSLHVKEDRVFNLSSSISEGDLQKLRQNKDAVILLIPNGKSTKELVYENALDVLSMLDPKNVSRIIASNPLFTVDDTTTDDGSNQNDVKTNKLGKWANNDKLNIAVDWHYGCNSSKDSEQYLKDFIGGALDRRTAASYEAVQVLSTLFKEGITREQIITGLKKLKLDPVVSKMTISKPGVAQIISFEDNGDRAKAQVKDRIMVSPVKKTIKTKDKNGVETITETITFKEIPGSICPSQQSGTNQTPVIKNKK